MARATRRHHTFLYACIRVRVRVHVDVSVRLCALSRRAIVRSRARPSDFIGLTIGFPEEERLRKIPAKDTNQDRSTAISPCLVRM